MPKLAVAAAGSNLGVAHAKEAFPVGKVDSLFLYPMNFEEFLKAGRRIHILERYMNTRMGISSKDDTLPERFLNEGDTKHPVKKTVDLQPMLKKYYRLKGYDSEGRPTEKILSRLGITR